MLQFSIALDPTHELVAVQDVDDERFVQVYLLLVGRATTVERSDGLVVHFVERVLEERAESRVRIVQVNVPQLEHSTLRLGDGEEVVRVRQELGRDNVH